jgi:hypothetical protein
VNPSLNVIIAIWVWIIIGAAGVIGAAILALGEQGKDVPWWRIAIILGIGSGGSGLLALAVAAAGWPSIALYVWRVTAISVTVIGAVTFLRNRPVITSAAPGTTPTRTSWGAGWVAAIGTILLIGYTWLSFQRNSLPKTAGGVAQSADLGTTFETAQGILSIFWFGALGLLGIGTLVFLFLFVGRLQRGGAPKIETHWGGIGGGLGGWRMSSSLGYLVVAIILTTCFSMLLLKLDEKEWSREKELAAQKALLSSPSRTTTEAKAPTPSASIQVTSPPKNSGESPPKR